MNDSESDLEEIPAAMECDEEPLTQIQNAHYARRNEKCIELNTRICQFLLSKKARHVVRNETVDVFQLKGKYFPREQSSSREEIILDGSADRITLNNVTSSFPTIKPSFSSKNNRSENTLLPIDTQLVNNGNAASTISRVHQEAQNQNNARNCVINNVNETSTNSVHDEIIIPENYDNFVHNFNWNTMCQANCFAAGQSSSSLSDNFCGAGNSSNTKITKGTPRSCTPEESSTPVPNPSDFTTQSSNEKNSDCNPVTTNGYPAKTVYEKLSYMINQVNNDRTLSISIKGRENGMCREGPNEINHSQVNEFTQQISDTDQCNASKNVEETELIDISDDNNECSIVESNVMDNRDVECLEISKRSNFPEIHNPTKNSGDLISGTTGVSDVADIETDKSPTTVCPSDAFDPSLPGSMSIYSAHCVLIMITNQMHSVFKSYNSSLYSKEQAELSVKISRLLSFKGTVLFRALIDCGLVRRVQYCSTHRSEQWAKGLPFKMKLAECSVKGDKSTGGYLAWICHICQEDKPVSIYRGSIFEGAQIEPDRLIKMIYHWCNQSRVQDVAKWLNVTYMTLNKIYFKFRAVCCASVKERHGRLGGKDSAIQVGFVNLWSFTNVVILGAMDVIRKRVRLQVLEFDNSESCQTMAWKVYEKLKDIVDEKSVILSDLQTDSNIFHKYGYRHVVQANLYENTSSSNSTLMHYLNLYIAKLFKNVFQLPKEKIQLFLDEIVWREAWGKYPNKAFETFVDNISEQTSIEMDMLYNLALDRIQENPFMDWAYNNWKENLAKLSNANKKRLALSTPRLDRSNRLLNNQKDRNLYSSEDFFYLGQYYYGSIPGDTDLLSQDVKYQFDVTCFICFQRVTNNIAMLKHIVFHALAEGDISPPIDSICYCRYCLRNFSTDIQLRNHLNICNLKPKSNLTCLICLSSYTIESKLILHMKNIHVELEMPYECGVCGFRDSEFKVLVDHFYTVHNGGEYVQCPLCLKVVSIVKNSRLIVQNIYFFYNHIKRHTLDKTTRQCDRCCLRFINDSVWKAHTSVDHSSFKGNLEVKYYTRHQAPILICRSMLKRTGESILDKYTIERIDRFTKSYYLLNRYDSTVMYGVPEGAKCSECEGNFLEENHFPGYMTCKMCRFSTCCRMAMNEHIALCHWKTHAKFRTRESPPLASSKILLCECGFQTFSGDEMAKHLYNTGRRTAYLVQTRIPNGNFPPKC